MGLLNEVSVLGKGGAGQRKYKDTHVQATESSKGTRNC